jgi:ABC-type transport system substrate-binding protein
MSLGEESKPKKKLKKWHIVVLVIAGLLLLGAIFGEDSPSPTPEPTSTDSSTPAVQLEYSAEITRWEPLNPASGRAVFTIRNTGEFSFVPQSCTVRVQDDSSTYKGFDFVRGFGEIKPGAKFMGNVVLTVTKEGAYFVTTGSVDCELEATP